MYYYLKYVLLASTLKICTLTLFNITDHLHASLMTDMHYWVIVDVHFSD